MAKVKFGTIGNDNWTGTARSDNFNAGAGNDRCIAGGGNDNVNGGLGNDLVDGGLGGDDLIGGAGNDTLLGGAGDDSILAGAGNDWINAGAGADSVEAGSGRDTVYGGGGDDNLDGGSGTDQLFGGAGNDVVSGGRGNDRMSGGSGNDILIWNDGDGSDLISGNDGQDQVEVNGSRERGDNFVLKTVNSKAFFERVGLDGQSIGQFSLTIDSSETLNVRGKGGNDTFTVNDVASTGLQEIVFAGDAGNDILDARATTTHITASGGDGNDLLIGGTGTVTVVGANNNPVTLGDRFTGGSGRDKFQFSSDPFAGGAAGQNVNRPDVITDYAIGEDQLLFDKQRFGVNELRFQNGNSNQLSGNSNLLVLANGFANAGAAAAAIRDNANITTQEAGFFVYFNTTLGISRVVFSENLADGGRFSVLGNLANQTNVANQTNFSSNDFSLV